MCSSGWAATAWRTSSGVSLPPGAAGMALHLWPVASTAPVSWTQMWPLWAAMAASWGRRMALLQVALVWVPPTKK